MNKNVLVDFSISRPKLILGLVALVTLVFLAQLPKIRADTNPKNMLPPTSDVRVWNDGVDRTFALYEDTIVVGIVHPKSVLNRSTLEKVRDITAEILGIKGVAWRDVSGFTTVDNVTAEGGGLKVGPLVAKIPQSDAEIEALRKTLFENPLLVDRLISRDEKISLAAAGEDAAMSRTAQALRILGGWGTGWPKTTVAIGLALVALAIVGVSRIVVNNNMVAWFKPGSEIRVADTVINRALGGTSLGYVVAVAEQPDAIKRPETLRYLEGLQRRLEKLPEVGKTMSVVDYVKRINRVLHDDDPRFDAVPETEDAVAQYLFLFNMSAKPSDLDNVVDYPFQRANVWVQLKTWDAAAMRSVIRAAEEYQRANPARLELKPAGIAYFNLVWNHEVLWDMVKGFLLALVVVFLVLVFAFRSLKWAVIGYVPLLFTILLIYGVVGFAGKDFDMPISVLSCLSLGMAVDFSIHFISRLRQRLAEVGADAAQDPAALKEALAWTAARPGKGILRNAVLFAAAFSVMLFAPLTTYMTVGAFVVSMMLLSALCTILYLPALIVLMRGWLFKTGETA